MFRSILEPEVKVTPLEKDDKSLHKKYGIGFKLLCASGYSAGTGLGKLRDGLSAPVATTMKAQSNNRGLGFTKGFQRAKKKEEARAAMEGSFCEFCFSILKLDNSKWSDRARGEANRAEGVIAGDVLCIPCAREIKTPQEEQEGEENAERITIEKDVLGLEFDEVLQGVSVKLDAEDGGVQQVSRVINVSARKLYVDLTGWVGDAHEATWRPNTTREIYEAVFEAAKLEEQKRRELLERSGSVDASAVVAEEDDIFAPVTTTTTTTSTTTTNTSLPITPTITTTTATEKPSLEDDMFGPTFGPPPPPNMVNQSDSDSDDDMFGPPPTKAKTTTATKPNQSFSFASMIPGYLDAGSAPKPTSKAADRRPVARKAPVKHAALLAPVREAVRGKSVDLTVTKKHARVFLAGHGWVDPRIVNKKQLKELTNKKQGRSGLMDQVNDKSIATITGLVVNDPLPSITTTTTATAASTATTTGSLQKPASKRETKVINLVDAVKVETKRKREVKREVIEIE